MIELMQCVIDFVLDMIIIIEGYGPGAILELLNPLTLIQIVLRLGAGLGLVIVMFTLPVLCVLPLPGIIMAVSGFSRIDIPQTLLGVLLAGFGTIIVDHAEAALPVIRHLLSALARG